MINQSIIFMANLEYARCPKCSNTVNGRQSVEKWFGLRTLNKKYIVVQSWCRKCRKKQLQEKRLNQN